MWGYLWFFFLQLPIACLQTVGMLLCLSVALTLLPSPLFQAQLPITPLTAAYRKKTIATPGSHESLLAYFWPQVLAALYTLSFTFLSAIIGWSDWANPFSFWHSLCCQRYSGSCSGKLTLKFPRLMNLLILPITSKYYGANRWWEKVNWSARGCHLVMIPISRIIYKEMCST